MLKFRGRYLPATVFAQQAVRCSQPAQTRQHQSQGHFRNRRRVDARHVGNRDAALAGRLDIDGVKAGPDFLNQAQLRRIGQGLSRYRLQHMPQHFRFRQQTGKTLLVAFGAKGDLDRFVRQTRDLGRQAGAGFEMKENLQGAPFPERSVNGNRFDGLVAADGFDRRFALRFSALLAVALAVAVILVADMRLVIGRS
ncbi:hypothetical protein MTBLM1_70289 [Rhodospirillaceae bacterium LM-1]|nr:hypothetical protein MTBLM1_70289 [Rhodospirillaceae bacterium LM-1]